MGGLFLSAFIRFFFSKLGLTKKVKQAKSLRKNSKTFFVIFFSKYGGAYLFLNVVEHSHF